MICSVDEFYFRSTRESISAQTTVYLGGLDLWVKWTPLLGVSLTTDSRTAQRISDIQGPAPAQTFCTTCEVYARLPAEFEADWRTGVSQRLSQKWPNMKEISITRLVSIDNDGMNVSINRIISLVVMGMHYLIIDQFEQRV